MRNSVLILISAFFLSCENPTDIGFPDQGGNLSQTFFTDTLSLETSTYLMDSAITSNQAAALVGSYTDPIFGKISAAAYLQPTLRQTTNPINFSTVTDPFTVPSGAVYDSIAIRLINTDLLIYGDSTVDMTIEVQRLTNPLTSSINFNYDQETSYQSEIIASKKISRSSLVNSVGDSLFFIKLNLPDVIGQELFALANKESSKSGETFVNTFRGFRISAKQGSKSLLAFNLGSSSSSSSSDMVLYYHESGSTTSSGYQFEFTAGRYNQISTDRSGTALTNLTLKTLSINSSKTGGKVYVQAGNGTAAKINFPGLKKLKNPQIGRAELVFSADPTSFEGNFPRAPFITLVEITDGQRVKMINGNYGYVNYTQNATSGILSTYVDSTNLFVADVTPYLQNITSQNKPDNGIALVAAIPAGTGLSALVFNAGLNRMVLQNFKLNLYYTEK